MDVTVIAYFPPDTSGTSTSISESDQSTTFATVDPKETIPVEFPNP